MGLLFEDSFDLPDINFNCAIYRERTWTGLCIQFRSSLQLGCEQNIIRSLDACVSNISSDESRPSRMQFVKWMLPANGYLERFF